MNIRYLKKSLLAFNILLTALILWITAMFFLPWSSGKNVDRTPESPVASKSRAKAATSDQTNHLAAYQTITRRDIFDTTPTPTQPLPAAPVQEEILPTQLQLRLNGTVVGDHYSYAVISDRRTNQEGIYALKDTVQGAAILDIQSDRVILSVNGKKEALLLFPEKEDSRDQVTRPGKRYEPPVRRNSTISRQRFGIRRSR